MSCAITSIDDLHLDELPGDDDPKYLDDEGSNIISLPRGGLIVPTSAGNIQLGMPPDTVKDSIVMGLEIPVYYVVPAKRFDFTACLNISEFEFPAYFNFFVRKSQICLICTEDDEKRIRTVFQETLLGPENYENVAKDFTSDFPKEGIPDFRKEQQFFGVNPSNPKELLTVDHLLKFIIFNSEGIKSLPIMNKLGTASIGEKVKIKKKEGKFIFIDGDKEIAKVNDVVSLNLSADVSEYTLLKAASFTRTESQDFTKLSRVTTYGTFGEISTQQFKPPKFGVTVLGNSHGFDPRGSTSGYIIWIKGRGILVDPPPFATYKLKKEGIPDSLIESIIVSHCHADHDAGVFQKILDTDKVQVITTRTILDSFLRKYSAITGISQESLKNLFKFRPVLIGSSHFINGAEFKFRYSLHTIPCISFEVFYEGKSLFFSGDTYYDPENVKKLVDKGIISQKRFDLLNENVFNHDIILHEAGVPPIHTPIKVLAAQSLEIKEKMYLVHVAEKDIPPNSGLRRAPSGLENTIRIVDNNNEHFTTDEVLDILNGIALFNQTSLSSLRDLVHTATIQKCEIGEIIFNEKDVADKFYVVLSGIVFIESKAAKMGDYFGEAVLRDADKRTATARAYTDATLLGVSCKDFLFIFGENDKVIEKILNLLDVRKKKPGNTIKLNSLLQATSSAQQIQFEAILSSKTFPSDAVLWRKGDTPVFVILIYRGTVEVNNGMDKKEYGPGVFIGESEGIMKGQKAKLEVKAKTICDLFAIKAQDFHAFLEANPKLLVNFLASEIIE